MSDKDLMGCLTMLVVVMVIGGIGTMIEEGFIAPVILLAVLVLAYILRRPLGRLLRKAFGALWAAFSKAVARSVRRLRRPKPLSEVNVDTIPWDQFEQLVGRIFKAKGYSVRFTPPSGDQGVDVIAEKAKQRVAIQAKKYEAAVGNDAVMAVHAGAAFYQCNRCIVVCTSTFTRKAVELADSIGVELWDRKRLESELRSL